MWCHPEGETAGIYRRPGCGLGRRR